MSYKKKHEKKAIQERGEIFTPEHLVEEMLHTLPSEYFTDSTKTMIDNSCGNGNFLFKILEWRMKNGISHIDAIKTIYGIELDENNAKECRERMSLGSKNADVWNVLNNNIICASALDRTHKGWKSVGYMWENKSGSNSFFEFS